MATPKKPAAKKRAPAKKRAAPKKRVAATAAPRKKAGGAKTAARRAPAPRKSGLGAVLGEGNPPTGGSGVTFSVQVTSFGLEFPVGRWVVLHMPSPFPNVDALKAYFMEWLPKGLTFSAEVGGEVSGLPLTVTLADVFTAAQSAFAKLDINDSGLSSDLTALAGSGAAEDLSMTLQRIDLTLKGTLKADGTSGFASITATLAAYVQLEVLSSFWSDALPSGVTLPDGVQIPTAGVNAIVTAQATKTQGS